MKRSLINMPPLEIAECSWREGHRHVAELLLTIVIDRFPDMEPSRFQEFADIIKEDEDKACAAFLDLVDG